MGCNSSKNSFLLESQDLLASKVLSETQDRSDSESLEATSLDFKGCPHAHFSVASAETKKYNLSDNDKTERKASPKNPAKIFLSFLIQTIFLLFLLGGLSFGLYKLVLSFDVKLHRLQEKLKTPPTPEDSIPKFFDFTKRFLTPAEWWDSNEADWDHRLWLTRGVVAFTSLCFAMDLLFSSPEEEGKWLMMLPALSLSIAYTLMSIYSEASDTFDPGMFWWKSIVLMGEQLFNRAEVIVLTFTDLSVLHLACSFAFLKDFYSRITSRRVGYRLLMIPLTLLTPLYGIASAPVYLLFRLTLFTGPEVWAPEHLSMNRSRQLREFGYLYDPIPKRGPGLTGWISQIPSPFCFVFFALQVASGCILSMLILIGYSFYVVFICLPVAALFFSLRRSFLRMVEMKTQGAVFGPFETLRSEGQPSHVPKAIVVVSGHLRLICFKQKENPVFNILIGWWLRKFLEFSVTFEFPATFHKVEGVPSYVDFLMEEFGPVFPFGQGLGFGKHKDVKAIIENPNHRKPTVSMITTMSEAQQSWSNKTTTELPTTEHEKAMVEEGRLLVHEWLKGTNEKLKKQETKSRLDYILPKKNEEFPKKNEDGTVLGEKRVKSSFGSTLFHLLTNGSLTRKEKKAYCALVEADRRLASDLINKVAGGGLLYRQSIQKYDLLRKAFLRYLNASSLQRSLALADKWDAWTSPEVVRFLTSVFAGNGNSAPAQLLWAIVEGLYQDETLVKEYQRDKRKFILEFARLERGVPMTYFMAHEFDLDGKKTVSIFNEEIEVSNGTRLHCSIMNANRDEEVFGADASELNFDRPRATLGQMLTFNGNLNAMTGDIEQQCRNSPPRDCPGFGITLDILEYLIDRFCPSTDKVKEPEIMKNTTKNVRLDSIRDHVSYTSYASELIYVIVELRKFVCHHSKELSFKVPELVLGAKDHKEYHSLDITPADIATFLEINKDIMGFNEITGMFFLLKEDDPIKDKPRRPLDVLEEDFNEWAKCKVKLVAIDDKDWKTQPVYAVGINDIHQRVTLIFRGSVFGNKDWPTNLNLLPARTCDLFAKSKYINEDDTKEMANAKFHRGFAQYLFRDLKPKDKKSHECKFDEIVDTLKKVAYGETNRQGYKLIISGHSLGGALTQLFAFALGSSKVCRSFVPTPVSAITYASPSIGNLEYGQLMQDLERERIVKYLRITNEGDIVPELERKRIVEHLRITNEGDIVPVFLQSLPGLGYTQTGCNLHLIPNQTGKLDGLGNTGSLRSQIGLGSYLKHSMDSYTDSLHARDEDEDVDLNSGILMRDLDFVYLQLSRGTVKDSRFYLAPDVYESWTVKELHDALASRKLGFDLHTERDKAQARGSDPLMGMDLAQGVVFDAITKLKEDDARTMSYAKQCVFPRLSSKELL